MMFVVLSYDVGEKRVGKISKIAKKYLRPVQRSLFEGFLNNIRLEKLKSELLACIDAEKDSVVVYKISNDSCLSVDELGFVKNTDTGIL